MSYAFLPDGSKEGWGASDEGDDYRDKFADLFRHRYDDGSTHDDVIGIRFGGDHRYEHPQPDARYAH